MSSLWKHPKSPFFSACFTAFVGQTACQLKLSTATGDRKLARRLADELEDAGQGLRSADQIKAFLKTIGDLKVRRSAHRAFDAVLLKTQGKGLEASTARGYLTSWLETRKSTVAPGTYSRYHATATTFLAALGGKADQDLALVTREDLTRFRDAEAKRVSPSSASLAVKIIRLMLRTAEEDGVIPKNPAAGVKRAKDKADRTRRRAFTVDEVSKILDVCDAEWRSLVVFGFYTGARLGDLALLTWQNVDLQKSELMFFARKTQKANGVPLAGPLRSFIEELPAGDDPKQPLHPRAHGIMKRDGRTGTLSRQFGELLEEAGLVAKRSHHADPEASSGRAARRQVSEVCFHALRHTMVSLLKSAGANTAVTMDIVGHDSAAVSQQYTHIDNASKLVALNKLPNVLKKRCG